MITYIYTVLDSSRKRGYNQTVKVYRIKNNIPKFLGKDEEIHTSSWVGGYGIACQIIARETNAKLESPYALVSDKIQVIEL